MVCHTYGLLAWRGLLAEEVHGMTPGQQPRNEVTDLPLTPTLQPE
jgi:hypothetical protein